MVGWFSLQPSGWGLKDIRSVMRNKNQHFFEHVEYSGCEHLIELSFIWLAWQNSGIIVREELYMLKSENPQTIGGLKPSSRPWMSLPLSGNSMLQEKALSDETTENLMSFTHTRIIQIPCREHCQYQGKRTSVSQLEKLQKIQSPVNTRPWTLLTKVSLPPLEATFQQQCLLLLVTMCPVPRTGPDT